MAHESEFLGDEPEDDDYADACCGEARGAQGWLLGSEQRERIDEPATFSKSGLCNTLFPYFANPRIVAGAPIQENIVKCTLKPSQ